MEPDGLDARKGSVHERGNGAGALPQGGGAQDGGPSGGLAGTALAVVLPLLIEYYTDHDLAARLAAGDTDAPARLGDVGVIGLYVGTAGIVVLVILAPQLAVFLGDAARWLPGQAAQIWLAADVSRADVTSAGLIILAWTTAAQVAGIVRLVRTDA